LGQFFTSILEEPVAAASLAQVYLATLNDGKDTRVAIKVQRPDVLSTVSKDLYVLRRAAEVFQGLVERFAPQQRTNYVALLNEWAIGFYTELDFQNEARNQERLTLQHPRGQQHPGSHGPESLSRLVHTPSLGQRMGGRNQVERVLHRGDCQNYPHCTRGILGPTFPRRLLPR